MSDDAEWGPWVQHDGKGCPVIGLFVERVLSTGGGGRFADGPGSERVLVGLVLRPRFDHLSAWDWSNFLKVSDRGTRCGKIIRYRIRRPRALLDLITLAAEPFVPPPIIGPDSPVRQPEGVPA